MSKIMAIVLSLMLLFSVQTKSAGILQPVKYEKVIQQQTGEKSKAFMLQVKNKIESEGITYPKIVYYQFREESGNGTSNKAVKYRNLFGMRYPKNRKTLAIGKTPDGYAIFKHWEDSVRDYKIFQETYYKGLSRDKYLKKLRTSYSGNPNYLEKYL